MVLDRSFIGSANNPISVALSRMRLTVFGVVTILLAIFDTLLFARQRLSTERYDALAIFPPLFDKIQRLVMSLAQTVKSY